MLLRSKTKGMILILTELTFLICLIIFPANPTYIWSIHLTAHQKLNRICDTFQRFVIRHKLLTERLNRDFSTVNCVKFSRSLTEDIMHC